MSAAAAAAGVGAGGVAARPSEASQRFLRAVREIHSDEQSDYPDEGIPEDAEGILAREGRLSFTMGSSNFVVGPDRVAACLFPPTVRPINWHYLRIFLEQFADMAYVKAISIMWPIGAVAVDLGAEERHAAEQVIKETRELIAMIAKGDEAKPITCRCGADPIPLPHTLAPHAPAPAAAPAPPPPPAPSAPSLASGPPAPSSLAKRARPESAVSESAHYERSSLEGHSLSASRPQAGDRQRASVASYAPARKRKEETAEEWAHSDAASYSAGGFAPAPLPPSFAAPAADAFSHAPAAASFGPPAPAPAAASLAPPAPERKSASAAALDTSKRKRPSAESVAEAAAEAAAKDRVKPVAEEERKEEKKAKRKQRAKSEEAEAPLRPKAVRSRRAKPPRVESESDDEEEEAAEAEELEKEEEKERDEAEEEEELSVLRPEAVCSAEGGEAFGANDDDALTTAELDMAPPDGEDAPSDDVISGGSVDRIAPQLSPAEAEERCVWFVTTRAMEAKAGAGKAAAQDLANYKYTPAPSLGRVTYGRHWRALGRTEAAYGSAAERKRWLSELLNDPRPIVVYVHGYANTLPEAAETAAALLDEFRAHKGDINVVLFSWPAKGGWLGAAAYFGDRERIANPVNVQAFRSFLRDLQPAYSRVVLLGHSMGNVLLMTSLAEMAAVRALTHERVPKAVFSVAAAVPNKEWIGYARQFYIATGRKVVLCCASCDGALNWCSKAHWETPAGLISGAPICSPAFHTLEVPPRIAQEKQSMGHTYFTTAALVRLMTQALSEAHPHAWVPRTHYGLTDPHKTKQPGAWHTLDTEAYPERAPSGVMEALRAERERSLKLEAKLAALRTLLAKKGALTEEEARPYLVDD